jgi:hypothetical protein
VITFEEAKAYLKETGTFRDVEIQALLTDADGAVRGFLKARNDPLWDELTAPPEVRQSVRMLLAHWDMNRGDTIGPEEDHDVRVWEAIATLLRRLRDPAWA